MSLDFQMKEKLSCRINAFVPRDARVLVLQNDGKIHLNAEC